MAETMNPIAGTSLDLEVFPVELVDTIFQHMSADKSTIATCTLVSQSWRDMAVPHLFRSVEGVQQTALCDFGDFLDAHPRIARCIQTLRLSGNLDSLPAPLCLREVFFTNTSTDPFTTPMTGAAASPRRLEQLSVSTCFDEWKPTVAISPPALICILQSFPADAVSMCLLTVADIPSSDPRMANVSNPTHRLRIRELNLAHLSSCRRSDYDLRHLYYALRRVLAPGCLQSLRTRVGIDTAADHESMRSFGKLVHFSAETLLELGLPFALRHPVDALEDTPDYWRILRLHECHRLRSFTIWIDPPLLRSLSTARGTPNRQHIPLSTMIIAILDHLPPTLRTLTLAFCDGVEPAHIKNRKLGLGLLDNVLSETRFSSLEMVKIVLAEEYDYEPPVNFDECSQAARETMPKCQQRGILIVELEAASM
ncbi:hypothetical protein GY45DRAFT_603197 [Cubamyces sp. BRFM 1775]|nr:hypothetical protein GY45DRAFT_603197 [Cubamyces sp. BRFM 1775]